MKRRTFQNNKNNSKNTKSFDYSKDGAMFKKTVSPAFYSNATLSIFLDKLSSIFVHMVENVKHIRKQFMYSVDSDESNIE